MKIQKINNTHFKSDKNSGIFSTPETSLPIGERNYSLFNHNKINFIVSQKENSIPIVKNMLLNANNEAETVEALYITDRLIENKTKGVEKLYPQLSRFNDSKSANIQTFLAGIYRKTQVPDAFGPLISMLIKNSISKNPPQKPFDPNEEIGGAILSYLENYSNKKAKIDCIA